jgi:release factor glutamine methyltransferase
MLSLSQTLLNLQALGLERLEAQLLLLHVLGRSVTERGWLLAHDSDVLAPEQASQLGELAQRRLQGEPLGYLTGHQAFYGLDLQVDARVLVPRPDTETLVDWALELLPNSAACSVLDLGTGSGAIALALKSSRAELLVHAVDLSSDALAVAQANAQRLQLPAAFSQGAWFDALPDNNQHFDCIVSNPPYIADQDPHLAGLMHEPAQALSSGPDGLNDIRLIVSQAPQRLKPGAWLLLEHGYNQATAVRELLSLAGFTQVQSRRDLAGIERCSGGQIT